MRALACLVAAGSSLFGVAPSVAQDPPVFGLPIDCPSDMLCPLQQMTDLDPGPGVSDPYCATASYDGHKGSDFRVLSLKDIGRDVPVIAMAGGQVVATRDGMEDRLVSTDADRAAVADRECGNGVVVNHGNGWETQYCHMRQGSVRVRNGEIVEKGSVLGFVGASGLAAFPHVHAGVRHKGVVIDPMTGRSTVDGCAGPDATLRTLFEPEAARRLPVPDTPQVLAAGFAQGAIDDGNLSVNGPPPTPDVSAPALTGYLWVINLNGGDIINVSVMRDGGPFASNVIGPLDRAKAVYTAFAGRKGNPKPGRYELTATISRNGETILGRTVSADIR